MNIYSRVCPLAIGMFSFGLTCFAPLSSADSQIKNTFSFLRGGSLGYVGSTCTADFLTENYLVNGGIDIFIGIKKGDNKTATATFNGDEIGSNIAVSAFTNNQYKRVKPNQPTQAHLKAARVNLELSHHDMVQQCSVIPELTIDPSEKFSRDTNAIRGQLHIRCAETDKLEAVSCSIAYRGEVSSNDVCNGLSCGKLFNSSGL